MDKPSPRRCASVPVPFLPCEPGPGPCLTHAESARIDFLIDLFVGKVEATEAVVDRFLGTTEA